jgi:MYXO-CTERM domain-containing protein
MAFLRFINLAALALLSAGLCTISWFPSTAHACSCLVQEPLPAFAGSTAVFEGRVLAITPKTEGERAQLEVKFTVLKPWKGLDAEKTITVTTSADSVLCGYSFAKKESYLVYASREADRLQTSLCTRTRKLSDAQPDLDAFKSDGKDSPASSAAKTLAPAANVAPAQGQGAPSTAPVQATRPPSTTPQAVTPPPAAPPSDSKTPASTTPEATTTTAPAAATESCSVQSGTTQSAFGWWPLALAALVLQRKRRSGTCRPK